MVWEFVPVGSSLRFPDGNGFYIAVRDTNRNQTIQSNGPNRFKSLRFVVIATQQSQWMNICNRCHISQFGHTKLPSVVCKCPKLLPLLSPFSWYISATRTQSIQSAQQTVLFLKPISETQAMIPSYIEENPTDSGSQGFISRRGAGGKASVSLLQNHPDRLWGSSSPLCNLYRGSFPRVKRSGNKAYHSPQSTAVVKNEWSYTFAPPICLQSLDRDKFLTLRFT